MLRLLGRLIWTEALRAIARHKLRNGLAALGITIGTASVVCVVAIGRAGTEHAEAQLQMLGDNLVWVEAGSRTVSGLRTGSHGMNTLTDDDAEAIRLDVPSIKSVSAQVDGSVAVNAGNGSNWTTHYRGVWPDFLRIRSWTLAEGSAFTEEEVVAGADLCLMGETVRQQLFGNDDPVGREVRIGTFSCTVIGLLAPKGQSTTGQDQDDTILLPETTVEKKIRGKGYTWVDDIMCSATSMESVPRAISDINALLRQRHNIRPGEPDDFNIRHPEEIIKAEIASKHTLAVFLISVAAVSLLVGGIGIMNVMLASVTERTREIGVRLAVGAKGWAVQAQFLGEAAMLSLFGGLAGMVLGAGASLVLARALEWPMSLPAESLAVAPAFSIAVGVFFGFYPALKAARLDPISALRYE